MHTEDGYKLAERWKSDAEFYRNHVERVGMEAVRSGERLMERSRVEALEEAASIAENFFNDDVVEGAQIARAIRDQIEKIKSVNKDESFVIKTMHDVLQRANSRRGR